MKRFLMGMAAVVLSASAALARGGFAMPLPDSPAPIKSVQPAALQAERPVLPHPTPIAPPTLILHERHGRVTPQRHGFQHTGGGNIDVAQPTPDVLIITMTGVAVAGPHPCQDSVAAMDFDLEQVLEIAAPKEAKNLKLKVEARVIGLLRSPHHSKGVAEESGACAILTCGPVALVTVCAPAHSVSGGESLSINDHEGLVVVPVTPGKYTVHQALHIAASNPHGLIGKAVSAEFAPDPALDPLWISYWEPFHGVAKKDFGFQVVIRIAAD
jgi:hypothetical protein